MQVPPVNHSYEYVVVPPEAADVSRIDCPLSIVGFEGVIDPAASSGLTVTWSAGEHADAAGLPIDESITL